MQKILIADDHVDTVETTIAILNHDGYSASGVYDGLQALRIAEEIRPQSILLDIHLPKLDGFRVAETLRQFRAFSETMIIGYSGFGGPKYYARAREAGMDLYLLKPTDPEILVACVEPKKDPTVFAENIMALHRDSRDVSVELIAKGQALSFRSEELLREVQEICKNSKRLLKRSQKIVQGIKIDSTL